MGLALPLGFLLRSIATSAVPSHTGAAAVTVVFSNWALRATRPMRKAATRAGSRAVASRAVGDDGALSGPINDFHAALDKHDDLAEKLHRHLGAEIEED